MIDSRQDLLGVGAAFEVAGKSGDCEACAFEAMVLKSDDDWADPSGAGGARPTKTYGDESAGPAASGWRDWQPERCRSIVKLFLRTLEISLVVTIG